jgi:DNA invertase Pin-like site-specific DNA recombinase
MKTPDRDGLPGCIYARISSVYGERITSLDNQEEKCFFVASKMGIPVPASLILKERDSGHETVDTRVDLLKVRQWAREGRISAVFIHAWDRLSRTPEELVSVWQELRAQGVQVVCLSSPVHELDIITAKTILRVQGMIGDMEFEYIRRRTTENKQRLRDAGKRVGEGGPLFGYKWLRREDGKIDDSRAWIIDEEEAKIVVLVFDLIGNQGLSIRQAMEELNRREVPTPSVVRGRKFKDGRRPRWSYNLRKMIVDTTYKGMATDGRKRRVGKKDYRDVPPEEWRVLDNAPTPAIVDEDLWQRANDNLKRQFNGFEKARQFAETRNKREFVFLRGILRCACCGGYMRVMRIRQWNRTTKTHTGEYKIAYKCDTRWDKLLPPEQRVCTGRAVYDERVREAAWQAVVEVITRTGWIEEKRRRLKARRPGEDLLRDSLDIARQELARTERRIGNVVDQMADAEDPEDRADLKHKLSSLRREKKGYESRIESLTEKLRGYDALDARIERLLQDAVAIRQRLSDPEKGGSWEERRRILDDLDARFLGDGETLHLVLDLGLADVTPEDGPLVISGTASRSNTPTRKWSS